MLHKIRGQSCNKRGYVLYNFKFLIIDQWYLSNRTIYFCFIQQRITYFCFGHIQLVCWSAYAKPGKFAVIYLFDKSIECSIVILNCCDNVILFVFQSSTQNILSGKFHKKHFHIRRYLVPFSSVIKRKYQIY